MPLRLPLLLAVLLAAPASAQLSGIYSVGSGGSFATLADAAGALQTEGVSGPVEMVLTEPADGDVDLTLIPGVSEANRITFRTPFGAKETVAIDGNGLVIVTAYVTFRDIEFVTSSEGVRVVGNSTGITFQDCIFRAAPGAQGILVDFAEAVDGTVEDSEFEADGLPVLGLRYFGDDLTLRRNRFTGSFNYAVTLLTGDGDVVEDNEIDWNGGLQIFNPSDDMVIQRNVVRAGEALALSLNSQENGANPDIQIRNNVFATDAKDPAVRFDDVHTVDFLHNTVVHTQPDEAGLVIVNSAGDVDVRNNLLATPEGGLPLSVEGGAGLGFVRGNVFSTPADVFAEVDGVGYETILAYQTGTDFGASSNRAPVAFADAAAGDYHLSPSSREDPMLVVTNLLAVTEDLDGDTRTGPYGATAGADDGDTSALVGDVYVDDDGADFSSVAAVGRALRYRGVSGAVDVYVQPGAYVGPLTLENIPGASPSDRLRFYGDPDAPPVVEHEASSHQDNWVVKVSGIDGVTLSGLRFRATGASYASVIKVEDAAALTIESCVLEAPQFDGGSGDANMLSMGNASGGPSPSLLVRDNQFVLPGSSLANAILLAGTTQGSMEDLRIEGNEIRGPGVQGAGPYGTGIRARNASGPVIQDNLVRDARTGLLFEDVQSPVVRRNRVLAAGVLLEVTDVTGTPAEPARFENNQFTQFGAAVSGPSITIDASEHVRFVHNSVFSRSAEAALRTDPTGISSEQSRSLEITRNVLHMEGTGVALWLRYIGAVSNSDHNRLSLGENAGPDFATVGNVEYSDLEAYRQRAKLVTVDGKLSETTVLRAPDDVRFFNTTLGNLALFGASSGDQELLVEADPTVTEDFDGGARGALTTYAGASESTVPPPLAPGDYTVGGDAPDFATIQEAARAVSTRGIASGGPDGDVMFFVRPGTYGGPTVVLDRIPGATAQRGVSFLAPVVAAGATPQATLVADLGQSAVRLDGVDNVLFGYLGLAGLGAPLVHGEGSLLQFSRVRFQGGTVGLSLGEGTNTEVFNDSHFLDQTQGGIHFEEQHDFLIDDVVIETGQLQGSTAESSLSNTGIALIGTYGGRLSRSVIDVDGDGDYAALVLSDIEAPSGHPGGSSSDGVQIVNNSILSGSIGVLFSDASAVLLAHNSVLAEQFAFGVSGVIGSGGEQIVGPDGSGARALEGLVDDENESVVRNNVFAAGGTVIAGTSVEALAVSQSNVIDRAQPGASAVTVYIDDPTNPDVYATLAAYQAATGNEAGSVEADVVFADASAGDFRLAGASVGDDALGVPRLAAVPTDLDGDDRPAFTYAGADEVADTPLTPPEPPDDAPFVITRPAPLGALAHGDAVSVRWATLADDIGPDDDVRVSVLCPGQDPFVRYPATPNDGIAGFLLPAPIGTHGAPTDPDSGCAVEVALAADPTRAAESAPFVVYDPDDKVGAVSTRAVDRLTSVNPARYGLNDVVSWTWDPATLPAGHDVDLSVVCDGRDEFVRYTATANDGVATARLPLVFGAYETCRVEVTSATDPAVFGRSGPFEVLGEPLPALIPTGPVEGEAIVMGQTYTVTWESESVPDTVEVRLVLRDLTGGSGNRLVGVTPNAGAPNGGAFAWSVPSDLSAGEEYRLTLSAKLADGSLVRSLVDGLTFTPAAAVADGAAASAEAAPEVLTLAPVRPNPSRGRAAVRVGVPAAGPVSVSVFDAVGRRVAALSDGERAAGWHAVPVESSGWAPGVYVVRVMAGGEVATRTLTVVR